MVLDRRKKGRMTKLFGQKNYLETAPYRKVLSLDPAVPENSFAVFRHCGVQGHHAPAGGA